MNEFIKPTKIEVNITLHKDLCENEEICPTCNGLGVVIRDNRYGLENDPDKTIMFPYKKQSLILCPTCYNGVIKRCNLCGKIIPSHRTKCDCDKQRELDRIINEIRKATKLALAPEATPEILEKNGFNKFLGHGMFFSKHIGNEEVSIVIDILFCKDSHIVVDIEKYSFTNGTRNSLHNCDIQSLHELQHALRLCGLNELADNFKVED